MSFKTFFYRDNYDGVESEQSILDTTITKTNFDQSVTNLTVMNVNTLKTLSSTTSEPSTSHIQPLITSTSFITSTPLNKNKNSNITESQTSSDFLPVTLNGISVIPKALESFPDKIEIDQTECSSNFPTNSELNDTSCIPASLKKGNNSFQELKSKKDHLKCKSLKKKHCSPESTMEFIDKTEVELELTNTQLVDETLKSEAFSENCEETTDIGLNDKPDSNYLNQIDNQSSPGLFSNSDSDILSIDESYLAELSNTVIAKTPPSKNQSLSSSDNDLLSYIEYEMDNMSSKQKCSVYNSEDTLDDDADLLSFVESETENMSAFTANKSKSLPTLPDVDMKDEDLLSFVENEENSSELFKVTAAKNRSKKEYQEETQSNKKENDSNSDSKQLLSRRPLFKSSLKASESLTNEIANCNVRTAPKKSGCEDVVLNEFFEPNLKEEEEDLNSLKIKRFTRRKKRQCTENSNMPQKKVKGIVFEPPDEEVNDYLHFLFIFF